MPYTKPATITTAKDTVVADELPSKNKKDRFSFAGSGAGDDVTAGVGDGVGVALSFFSNSLKAAGNLKIFWLSSRTAVGILIAILISFSL